MNQGVRAVKTCCAAMARKLSKLRDRKKRECFAFLASADGEYFIADWVNENESKVLGDVSASEFGDGVLLDKWLEWLGGDGFKNFVDTIIPLIEKIFEIIAGIAI